MKRFRLSTLMLLIVIVAMGVALVVQHQRAARREAEIRAELEIRMRLEIAEVERIAKNEAFRISVQAAEKKRAGE